MYGGDNKFAPLAEITGAMRVPVDDVADQRIQAVLSYWYEQCLGADMPRRADIEPTALRAHLDRVSLVDVSHDPLRFRFRLVGTGVTRVIGHDNTGQSLDEIEPKAQRDILIAHYSEAVNERAPVVHEVQSRSADGTYRYVRICCPLSEDGNTVNMLLLASFSLDDTQTAVWEELSRGRLFDLRAGRPCRHADHERAGQPECAVLRRPVCGVRRGLPADQR